MHIYISQTNNSENINTTLINKLYKLIKNNDQYGILTENSTFLGALIVNTTYKEYEDYIESKYPLLSINASKYYILFRDQTIKELMISNFASDGTGISNDDILMINSLNNVFKNNENIQTFEELNQLTNVKYLLVDEFRNCINLTNINLNNISIIRNYALNNTHIYSLNSNSIQEIWANACADCKYLQEIDIPNCTSIGQLAFSGCISLQSLTLNCPNLNSIGASAFYKCNNLSYIDLSKTRITSTNIYILNNTCTSMTIKFPKTLTELKGKYVNFDSLTTVYITGLENVQTWTGSDHTFYKGTILTPLCFKGNYNWPADIFAAQNRGSLIYCHSFFYPNIKVIGNSNTDSYGRFLRSPIVGYQAHTNGNIYIKLLYFKQLEKMGYAMFFKCIIDNLVINNVNVPLYDTTSEDIDFHTNEFDETPFGLSSTINNTQIGTLWVPDEAVSTYQVSPLFAGITIKGINTMTDGEHYDLPRFATFEDWEEAYQYNINNGLESPVGLIEEWM